MRLILWLVALASLVLGTWMIWGSGWSEYFTLTGSVGWLERSGPWAWAAGIALLAGDLILPVPGTIVISALGYIYGFLIGGLVATTGLVVAGLLGYGVGWLFGERTARRWLGARDFERGRLHFASGGGWVVAMSRALPILPEVISCTAGLVRMPFKRFVVALVCGSVPMGFLFAAIGQAGHDAPEWSLVMSMLAPGMLWFAASRIMR